jgi:hypothetical protein
MAKLVFYLPSGEQLTFRLFTDRRLRIGRERGNDIVIRDARVSRAHAELSFERGFFVIRDLGSSNGTFVNGREVKAAPLTEGAEIRVGNTVGRFSEELPGSTTGSGGGHRREKPPAPPVREPAVFEPDPFEPDDADGPGSTRKHPKLDDPPWEYHREQSLLRKVDVPESDSRSLLATARGGDAVGIELVVERSESGRSTVLDVAEGRKFYFEAPWSAVGILASLTAIAMLIGGFGASIAFLGSGELVATGLTVVLTAVFVLAVVQLTPRLDIALYEDEELRRPALALRQESRGTFPALRYSARDPDGEIFACFRKRFLSNFGARRWSILDPQEVREVASVVEEKSARAVIRKFLGALSTGLVTDFFLRQGGEVAGRVVRNAGAIYRSVTTVEPSAVLDRRAIVCFAVLFETVEPK